MSSSAGAAGSLPTAELDRRFYAFTLDRLLAWSVYALASWAAWILLLDEGRTWAGVAVIAGTVVVLSLVLSFVLGLLGTSPGKAAVGLRVVDDTTGTPIGVGPALLRTLVLGVAALPTFGIGVVTLAWTAVMDRDRQRRGWHDHLTRSVVVDVRPAGPEEETAPQRPRQIVNLTAMRLVPASPLPPREIPARVRRSRWAVGPTTGGPPAEVPGSDSAPEVLRIPDDVPTPGPTPEITLAVPLSESGPAAPLSEVPAAGSPGGTRVSGRHAAPTAAPAPVPAEPAAPPPRWSVTFDTGEAFVVDGFTLVGRNPEKRPGERVKRLLALPSEDMSLSKTHAQFQVVPDGALVVMDRGSTNGSLLIRGGVTRELGPGKPATLRDGDVVRFGDREMRVVRG